MPGARSKLARQADGFVETGRLFRSSMKALRAVGINNTLAANLANEAAASLVGIDVAEATRRKRYQLPDGAAVVGPHSVTWLDPAAQAPRRVAETIWLGDHIARFRAAVDDYEADE